MRATLVLAECVESEDAAQGGKQIVFGLIKRGGKVYTQVVENCSVKELDQIIKEHVSKDSESIQMGLKPAMAWLTLVIVSIIGSGMERMNSPMDTPILMGLKTFGDWQRPGLANLKGFRKIPFICT